MKILSWQDKKKRIIELIKLISDFYGGDDPRWLKSYSDQIIKGNTYNLDKALACFEDLWTKCELKVPRGT